MSEHVPGRDFSRALLSALRTLDTPRSLSLYVLLRHKEWDQLTAKVTHPSMYLDTVSGVERYRLDIQAEALVRKVPWPTSFSRRTRALLSFRESELRCCETNHFIDWLTSGVRPQDRYLSACRGILDRAKKFASYVLGPLPETLNGRFGPGTVFELKGTAFPATLADKVVTTPHATSSCEPVFRLISDGTLWHRLRMKEGLPFMMISPGNRLTTVPKDGTTDRGICIEPSGNLYCQLAVGDYMKVRLKRVGLDVARSNVPSDPIQLLIRRLTGSRKTGQEVHRDLAETASRDGSWATIDLSNASDTVARKLVEAILPADWFLLLDSLRSPKTLHPDGGGTWVLLEKFSSMGNGFTFELETLIFACLCKAVENEEELETGVSLFVYGDDIIVPAKAAPNVLAVLAAFGFQPNRGKTFTTGFFRESCGGDFFCGFNVRPRFVTSEPCTPTGWMELFNLLQEIGVKPDIRLFEAQLPARVRFRGPRFLDGVFHDPRPSTWSSKHSGGIHWVRRIVDQPLRLPLDRWDEWSHLALALLGVGSRGVSPPRCVTGYRISFASVS